MLPLNSCPRTAKYRPSGEGTPQVRELDFCCHKGCDLPFRSRNNRVDPNPDALLIKNPLPSGLYDPDSRAVWRQTPVAVARIRVSGKPNQFVPFPANRVECSEHKLLSIRRLLCKSAQC